MKSLKLLVLCLLTVFATNSYCQTKAPAQGKSTITGKVTDESDGQAMPYVSVAVLKTGDSSIVNGAITNEKGIFTIANISRGTYILKYTFVGYKDVFKNIEVKNATVNVPEVAMKTASERLQEVKIVGSKQMMEYKLDKRVINVDQNLVSTGGNASDVLEDVPSVEVDDEGNISLRGGSNVTLLIDGKPSSMYGSDVASVLAQIPASSIDKIEVITNPSAKYNPEGMSGIINITLKEKGNRGLNGNINVSSGASLDKFIPRENLSASLNWSNKKFSLTGGLDGGYGERSRITDNIKFTKYKDADYISDITRTYRDGGNKDYRFGLNLGAEWYINKLNTLGLTFNSHAHISPDDYSTSTNTSFIDPVNMHNNVDESDGKNHGTFNNIGLNYEKKFKDNHEHLFYANVTWGFGNMKRKTTDMITYADPAFNQQRGDTSSSTHNHANADIHYVHPFNEKSTLEVGYNLNYSKENSNYEYSYDKILNTETSYDFYRQEQVHALYATYGLQIGKQVSAQLGLRGEVVKNDFRREMYTGFKEKFDKDYNSLYPTVHLSYQLNQMNSFQISYSRRIQRPGPWSMMPNVDLSNPEYIRFGNPKIDPEYTNAYELGYSLMFKNTTIFTSLYYRYVNNAMKRFEFPWTEEDAHELGFDWAWDVAGDESATGKTAQTFMNIAKSSNYGMEIIIDRDITNWWRANLSMNFFGSYQDGTELKYDKSHTFNFNAKLNTTITLPKNWTIQVSGRYYAPRKDIQGRRNARWDMDLAIKKSIWNKQGSIGLNFRDVFATRGGHGYSYTEDYLSFTNRRPYSRSIRLSFSYNFGKTADMRKKAKKQSDNSQNNYYQSGESYSED